MRKASLDEKRAVAARLRQQTADAVTDAARKAFLDDKKGSGDAVREGGKQGKERRENERQKYLDRAFTNKGGAEQSKQNAKAAVEKSRLERAEQAAKAREDKKKADAARKAKAKEEEERKKMLRDEMCALALANDARVVVLVAVLTPPFLADTAGTRRSTRLHPLSCLI